jgi:hypothetical protein
VESSRESTAGPGHPCFIRGKIRSAGDRFGEITCDPTSESGPAANVPTLSCSVSVALKSDTL